MIAPLISLYLVLVLVLVLGTWYFLVPESSNVIEVSDCSADLLVVPCRRLRLVLDHIVLDVTANFKKVMIIIIIITRTTMCTIVRVMIMTMMTAMCT